ncbi:MAG: CorA family divalent cation transporter [Candidatus Taylorbacteria bacterium]|nr:CorA family divalent cation transporter [Candidatus Taylorbacteria bacterium]
MILKYTHKNLTWIDLECPTHEEARQMVTEWNIHPLVAQELIGPTTRPKVELYGNFIYLILHIPTIQRKGLKRLIEQQEIDFIIGKNFIITSRYDAIDPLHQFSKLFEVNSILDRSDMGEHAGFIFFYMIRALYEAIAHELESVTDIIREIEENIFKGKERNMVFKISEVSRELLDVRRATSLHKEILESFESASRRFFGEDWSFHTRAIIGEYYKVDNAIRGSFESVAELRETNNSLLNTRETETMKMITIVVFLTLPASVITNFFQMSTAHTPIVGQANDWLIVTSITFISTVFLVLLAKFKKWF